jgi:hypothetical protein
MPAQHCRQILVQLLSHVRRAEYPAAAGQKLGRAVGNLRSPSKHPHEGFLVILLICAVQCLIPTFSTATVLAEDAATPHHDSDSVKRAQNGSFVRPEAHRPRPEPAAQISMLEPEVASGTSTNRPKVEPAPSRVQEPSIISRTYELRGDYVPTSHSTTAPDEKPPRYTLLSWPRNSSFAYAEAAEVSRRKAISGSSALSIADAQMAANGPGGNIRPLLEIHLGVYKLPVFLYAPNPEASWPRW